MTPASTPRRVERAATAITCLLLVGGLCALWLTGVSSIRHLVANLIGSYVILWGLVLIAFKGLRADLTTGFALSSLALGALLLCFEAAAVISGVDYRILFGYPIERARWQRPPYTFDAELGWITKPDLRIAGTAQGGIASMLCLDNPARPYDAVYDRHGFRNDVDRENADIAVIGDSFVEGVETPHDRILTTVLARLTETTVANLGQGVYGPRQQLIVLNRYALPLRPQAVVWTFYEGNDLQDMDSYDAMISKLRRGEVEVAPSAYERSFVVSALKGLFGLVKGCTPAPAHWFASGVFRTAEGQDVRMHFAIHGKLPNDRWSAKHARALAKVREVFQQAHELTHRQGIALVVAFIPSSFRVHKDVVQCVDVNCSESELNDLPQRLGKAIRDVSARIRYIDLTPSFIAEAKRGRLVYLPDDLHWSAEGHRVAAEAIAAALDPLLRKRQR